VRRILAIVLPAALLIGAAPASARIVAHLHAPGHHPRIGKPWPVRVKVRTASGHRVSGRMDYQFLFRGEVVSRQPGVRFRRGRARDKLTFPGRALGYPITVRFVISTHRGNTHIDYRVRVRR
jgi:hypothetical protein